MYGSEITGRKIPATLAHNVQRTLHSHTVPARVVEGVETMAKTGFGFSLKKIFPYLFHLLFQAFSQKGGLPACIAGGLLTFHLSSAGVLF